MSPPLPLSCSNAACDFETPPNIPTYELVIKCLELHNQSVHMSSSRTEATAKVEKPKRPSVQAGMSETDWTFFVHKWDRYVRQTKLEGQQLIDELWACMDSEIERLAFNDNIAATTQSEIMESIKKLAVTVLHPSLHVVALHEMKQQSSETTKTFSARVKGVATNCNLTKKCSKMGCGETVSFIDETCYHVVLAGLHDVGLREKVLTQAMLGTVTDLTSLINYAAAEESSKVKSQVHEVGNVQEKRRHVGKCNWCGLNQHGLDNARRQTECKAYGKSCTKCSKPNHFAVVCKSNKNSQTPKSRVSEVTAEEPEEPAVSGFITLIEAQPPINHPATAAPVLAQLKQTSTGPWTTLPVSHHVFNEEINRWTKQPPKPSPTIQVSVSIDKAAYKELELNAPDLIKKPGAGFSRARKATTDTGAQLTVINEMELTALGVKKNSIFPLAMAVNTVTKTSIDLIGGIFLKFTACDPNTGRTRMTRQLCYVSKAVRGIYLSEDACIALQCVPSEFPKVGECSSVKETAGVKCQNTGVGQPSSCECPVRTAPPTDVPKLPCEPTPENLPIIKAYILDRYASSGFNTCENQALPLMETAPPLRLFVDPQATPVAAYTPGTVPIHWASDVKAGLDRDEKLGVLEKVPVNEPVTWCSRMVITPKSDGSPRRVIDFGPLNRNAPRQPHHTRSPHTIAMSVPDNVVKTVLDNWHGYHSVPIHPSDRHLTTFITPYGRYRYRTAPQGFTSAGDGYTQRMDLIVEGTKNFDHCVDDAILWDSDIETNFFSVCQFIEKCASAGCIFNPKKFQFGQDSVDFLRLTITKSGI